MDDGKIQHPQGVGRLVNLYPNEPEVLVTSSRYGLTLWASRIDAKGYYAQLGSKPTAGSDSGESRGLGFVQQVDVPSFVGRTGSGVGVQGRVASPEPSLECGYKGVVAALEGGVACYPISAFLPNGKDPGWCFNTGGVPAVAALVEDINGEGVPEVLLGRVDGFVDVLRLSDGQLMGLLSTGQPIVGMVMLKNHDGKPCLAVGTKMGVHLFGSDPSGAGLKRIGSQAMPVAAFVGPGGKARDRAYVVDSAGQVTVLILK